MKKVAIIGHFGGTEDMLDGQTVKTKVLYEELKNSTDWKIIKVDTYYKNKNPFKLFFNTVICLLRTKDVIVLLSGNGMKFYFPLLYFCTKFLGTRVYHDVIGGNLSLHVVKHPQFIKYLNSFQVNWVETGSMKRELNDQGIHNCAVMPNFKRLKITNEINSDFDEPYCFCTFSRVMKEKGIEIAVDTVKKINKQAGKTVCKLDIFGIVDGDRKEWFENLKATFPDYIKYKGSVPFNKSAEVLENYFALLFPTFWEGEGLPGTIIDAFFAGLPVIASDWNFNAEILNHMETGIIYPNDGFPSLEASMNWAINNVDSMIAMRQNCLREAERYMPDKYIAEIKSLVLKG